jgi:AGCS family alanine or glycine:cation symporter
MQTFERIVNFLNDLVWNTPEVMPLMVVVLLSYGLFITVRLGFIQIRKLKHGFRVLTGYYDDPDDQGDINHFQALSTALSATVGIGNIAGVAIAIHYGGPGALFWMWITALFGMAIKYSECTLAVLYREQNEDGSVSGGPMYYIEKGLGSNWKWLSIVFAASAVICSFLTGNAIQANTVADSMESAFMIPVYVTGVFTAGFVAIVILGGIKRIGNVTAKLTPLMAVIYVLGALIILLMNYDQVIPTLGLIITSAFDPVAGVLGVGSGAFMTTLVWGIKRGLFSNEAGQGSAPIAHAAAKTDEPVREGVVALLEPFIDTLIVCTMTGLVICITGSWDARHPSAIFINSGDTSFATEQTIGFADFDQDMLIVENGVPANGQVLRYGVLIDTLYSDAGQSQMFSGTIYIGPGTRLAYDPDENPVRELYGKVVENGAPLTARAFEIGLAPLFPGGAYLVTICVLLFGVSTSISWSYYGDRSIQYLLGDKSIIYYRIVYIIMHFVGAILALGTVWAIGDVALGLMTLPNLIALFALSGVVYRVTHEYFNRMEAEDLNK